MRVRHIVVAALALVSLLAATACEAPPPPKPKKNLGHVMFVGDSITWSSRDNLVWGFALKAKGKVSFKAVGGTAPCDVAESVKASLRSSSRPDRLVMQWFGNNLTACMGAKAGIGGHEPGSPAFMEAYRKPLAEIASVARSNGVQVVWASSPPHHPTKPAPELNARLADMARGFGWRVVDAGAAVSNNGQWTLTLPCRADEPAKGVCKAGRAQVRSNDLVHFVQFGGYNPGAWRWAEAVIDGL